MANLSQPLLERARGLLSDGGDRALGSAAGVPRQALLEAGFLVAASDDDLSVEEASLLGEMVDSAGGGPPSGNLVLDALELCREARDRDGVEGRLRALAHMAPGVDARRALVRFAVIIALCDTRFVPRERGTLQLMGRSLGIGPEEIAAIIEQVRLELEGEGQGKLGSMLQRKIGGGVFRVALQGGRA